MLIVNYKPLLIQLIQINWSVDPMHYLPTNCLKKILKLVLNGYYLKWDASANKGPMEVQGTGPTGANQCTATMYQIERDQLD